MHPTVIIAGHSLIARLATYGLNMGLHTDTVRYMGIPGATISRIRAPLLRAAREDNPKAIILQIGGNDIGNRTADPAVVTAELKGLVEEINIASPSTTVVVLSLLERLRTRRHDCPVREYNRRVRLINGVVPILLSPSTIFWNHKNSRLANPFAEYCPDGVHFKNQKKYYKSVKGAILKSLK